MADFFSDIHFVIQSTLKKDIQMIPMRFIKAQLKDGIYVIGLILLACSLFFFCIPVYGNISGDKEVSLFFMQYVLVVVYFFALLFSGRFRKGRNGLHVVTLFLLLFLLSAYALNRAMNVFATSTGWFIVALIVFSINLLSFAFIKAFPRIVRVCMFFILGVSLCCYIYLSIYLLPVSILGVVGFFLLGIPLHAFVPALLVMHTIIVFRRSFKGNRLYLKIYWSGIGATILIAGIFCLCWRVALIEMDKHYQAGETGVPAWVNVAKHTAPGFVVEKVLKGDLVYNTGDLSKDRDFFRIPSSRRWNEELKHDPLVMIASVVGGMTNLSGEDRIHILGSMYDSRHKAEEQLWSGRDLHTTAVHTAAHLWPALRMSYTEQTIQVANKAFRGTWGRRSEEAIYTFHLPEGAVISALSLWIDSVEQQSVLTTKAKADSAYKTIVGVESRDPSVVHWKEGNTVTVRVFPVFSGESRQFKIGITAPLSLEKGQLVYRNIYFDGPPAGTAKEEVAVTFESLSEGVKVPFAFNKQPDGKVSHTGAYQAKWQLSCKEVALSHQLFGANGKTFTVMPYKKELGIVDIKDVYLDVNKTWEKDEFDGVLALLQQQRVWVNIDRKMIEITVLNKEQLFDQLKDDQFSLFPFFDIKTPATSLVITKGMPVSPIIGDLQDSEFLQYLKVWMGDKPVIMLYNLGGELSPYQRTLQECRTFRYVQDDMTALKVLLHDHHFPVSIENDQQVVIAAADMAIITAPGTGETSAPDHLQRLFAYNHIMHEMGPRLLTGAGEEDDLMKEAAEAHIVTPLSSLVVLEKQADYDRFNIQESESSLKNASLNNKGAVPEPHEWALIIIGLLLLLYIKYKPAFLQRNLKI
jgi:XrtN system VIT domain protein